MTFAVTGCDTDIASPAAAVNKLECSSDMGYWECRNIVVVAFRATVPARGSADSDYVEKLNTLETLAAANGGKVTRRQRNIRKFTIQFSTREDALSYIDAAGAIEYVIFAGFPSELNYTESVLEEL